MHIYKVSQGYSHSIDIRLSWSSLWSQYTPCLNQCKDCNTDSVTAPELCLSNNKFYMDHGMRASVIMTIGNIYHD